MLATPLRKFGYHYYLIEQLNSDTDSAKFYEVFSVLKNFSEIYALKLFRKGYNDLDIKKEIEIYGLLTKQESPYFLKYISNSKDELIVKEKYIVLEFAEKGTLKDYILLGKFFSERTVKILTWNIFQAFIQLHEIGIVHKKISLENILLDKFYNLKIGGFGFAEFIENEETKEKNRENAFKEDIYNLGFLIIQLLTRKLEFKNINDNIKSIIKHKKFEAFWVIVVSQTEVELNREVKDLINIMLSKKISDLRTLLNHNWFNELRASINKKEFTIYEQFMKKELKCIKESEIIA